MRDRRTHTPLGGKRRTKLKQIPFPGLIDGNPWVVEEGSGPIYIDRSDIAGEGGVMHVPLDDDDLARKFRLHEEAHVAWTPEADVSDVAAEELTINACEDARIVSLLNLNDPEWQRLNYGVDTMPTRFVEDYKREFSLLARKLSGADLKASEKPIRVLDAARTLAATYGTYEWQHVQKALAGAGLDWITQQVEELHERFIERPEIPSFDDTLDYAEELERRMNELEQSLWTDNAILAEFEMPGRLEMPGLDDDDGQPHRWGEMEIQRVPLPAKLRGDPSRRPMATDLGYVPRYMHRTLTDQRVFARRRKKRKYQGTVVIDHSGSMGLTGSQVDKILRRWPAVTIATYSGWSGSRKKGGGILRIVASKGRRADDEHLLRPAGQGNCVDGPALDWLGRQKGPRVWISDGHVSGKGEDFRPWFRVDAARKMKRFRIIRIDGVQQLIDS